MNYGNRNASSSYTLTDLGRGYVGAVAASVSIALGTRMIFAPTLNRLKGGKYVMANALLNYIAGAAAGGTNLALMRMKELNEGVEV